VLSRIFLGEIRREWRKLHNEELNDFHSSPNIIQVNRLKIMGWAGHIARRGRGEE